MKFTQYTSIENSYRQKEIDSILYYGKSIGEWAVSEKIHGANMSMWFDGTEFRVAKKTGFISPNGSFFGFDDIDAEEYRQKIEKLFKICQDAQEGTEMITVYGEWCGGSYPHPDVPAVPSAKCVQKKHYYSPDNQFIVFDLKINGNFRNVDEYEGWCKKAGLYVTQSIFRGSFEDCINCQNEYPSKIYKMFDLPEIDNNICEGNVIKPVTPNYLPCGSRVILKNKNDKHKEKCKSREPKAKVEIVFNELQQKLFEEMLSLINKNRLRNVLSHIGQIDDKGFGKLQGLFVKDAIEDFLKDFADDVAKLTKDEWKCVVKRIQVEASVLVRQNFLAIIDGNF